MDYCEEGIFVEIETSYVMEVTVGYIRTNLEVRLIQWV